jgi:hypothetical protein
MCPREGPWQEYSVIERASFVKALKKPFTGDSGSAPALDFRNRPGWIISFLGGEK